MNKAVDFKQEKINLIKDLAAGVIEPAVVKYLLDLFKDPGINQHTLFFYNEETGEILEQDKIKKELHDKLPAKYKSMFTYSLHGEICKDIGRVIRQKSEFDS